MMNARVPAPELPATLQWVNTEQPPTLASLRGRVTLLHFWTFDCIHCLNLLIDLRYLENKYHDGLTVIGIHTPKYSHQRDPAPVLKAVNRHHVRHPVANDPNFLTWQAYGIAAWPTVALVDAQGQLAALLPGEGRRQETDTLIGQLLDEAAARDLRVYESSVPVQRPEPKLPLRFPRRLLVTDSLLWIADTGHNRILECTHEGRIQRQFGSGNPGLWDGRNQEAGFNEPQGLALLKDALYVADTGNHVLRRIRLLSGEVETIAGTGVCGYDVPDERRDPKDVAMSAPSAIVGIGERLYFAVAGQHQIWQLDLVHNRLGLLAGNGQLGLVDGEGVAASLAQPSGLAVLGQQLVVADAAASAIRLVRLLDNRVSTLLGVGVYEFGDAAGQRDTARLQHPLDVCVDPRGLVFIADSYNAKIKALNLRTGEVRALNLPYRLNEPAGIALAAGALWIANSNAHEILRVDLGSGQIRRLDVHD